MNAKATGKTSPDNLEATLTRYAVETVFTYSWETCWTNDNGRPLTLATYEEAEQAMKDRIIDCINAVEEGFMEDSPDPAELRKVPVCRMKGPPGARWTSSACAFASTSHLPCSASGSTSLQSIT